jgi:hypothetical protein
LEHFLSTAVHHFEQLITNPIVIIILIITFAGEYIPFTKILWKFIGIKFKKFGEFLFNLENKIYKTKAEWIEEDQTSYKINNFFIKILLFTISAIITIFIELVWELGFRKVTKKVEKSKFAIYSAKKIKELPDFIVLVLFTVPFMFMEFIGIFSATAIAMGYIGTGVGIYLFKILFFIPVHFVLEKGKEKLMKIKWFSLRYTMVVEILKWFRKSQTYVYLHNFLEKLKSFIKTIKNLIMNRVKIIRKTFEEDTKQNKDIITTECRILYNKIKEEIDKNGKVTPGLYKKFYNCIDKNLLNLKKEENGHK